MIYTPLPLRLAMAGYISCTSYSHQKSHLLPVHKHFFLAYPSTICILCSKLEITIWIQPGDPFMKYRERKKTRYKYNTFTTTKKNLL